MHPSIDHSGLSPSGRVSKRARIAWERREYALLFPPGTFAPPPRDERAERVATMRRSAANLRDLAARGMRPLAHAKAAERLEAEAAKLAAEAV